VACRSENGGLPGRQEAGDSSQEAVLLLKYFSSRAGFSEARPGAGGIHYILPLPGGMMMSKDKPIK